MDGDDQAGGAIPITGSCTITLVEPVTEPEVAVMVVLPGLSPVTSPLPLTDATLALALRH